MRLFGYSTGAIALGDFARALEVLSRYDFDAVELSALRISEVGPLIYLILISAVTNTFRSTPQAPSLRVKKST
jgi:hypothetical protein